MVEHHSPLARLLVTLAVGALLPTTQLAAQHTAATTGSRSSHPATQRSPSWTVRPEWVEAHERFLSSDVMHGRGSATRDEQITATYVASEFMSYGLKPAPGMTGYIQSAEVVSPELAGNATLTVGKVTLKEGDDFQLLVASGAPVSGTLLKVLPESLAQAHAKGAIVMVGGDAQKAMAAASQLIRAGAALVLVPQSPATDALSAQLGGHARVGVRLKDSPRPVAARNLAVLTAAAMARLASENNGAPAALSVQVKPEASPRRTFNAVGYLAGTDPSAGTILLSAHLDHLGIGRPVNGDSIYNGANDDAAGTTAVMELAHALAAGPRLRRSILFVCYGSEEIGELGSTYFGEHPPVPLTSLVANVEFEMIGSQDPKMPKGVLLFTGWDRSNLGPALKAHGALLGPDPYPEQHFFERSDNYALALQGVVAHTAAGWGTPPTYHQPDDELSRLDIPFMTSAIQSLIDPLRWLATSDFKPAWNAGGRPER
ncbi:MAG TPA: M28 family peptidase [Gemmatimonadaceae bacterium]|nr:M28 family peptidase [Gemmatimonadaceae bacterium]